MAGRPLRVAAAACSIVVLLGVLLFTIDQLHGASKDARARLGADVPAYWPGSAEAQRAATASTVADPDQAPPQSRFEHIVTEANDILLAPFDGVVPATADVWTRELVPAFLALLLYGVGLNALANLLARRPRQPQAYAPPPHWQ